MSRASSAHDSRVARQLPAVASEVARLVDSGATLHLALAELAVTFADPVAGELACVIADVERGMLLDESLTRWARRSGRSDVELLTSACRLGITEGGRLVGALEGVAAALNDALELLDEARALTSQSRTSALVLVALPVFGLALFATLDTSVLSFLMGTPIGWTLLVSGITLDMAGAATSMWLVRRALR